MTTRFAADTAREEGRVQAMFDRIAGRYDRMNSIMTAGLHRRWRERAADLADLGEGGRALDVCCGTGDFALALKHRVGAPGAVVGTDFSEPMLALARRKAASRDLAVEFVSADTLDLPFADGEFDAVTVGFGLRNLPDLDRGLAEMTRVAKAGGRVVCLEITTPRPPLSWFFALWFDRIVPRLGALAGHSDAYAYLPWSVRNFPDADGLAAAFRRAGVEAVRYERVGGGIVAIHHGRVAPRGEERG